MCLGGLGGVLAESWGGLGGSAGPKTVPVKVSHPRWGVQAPKHATLSAFLCAPAPRVWHQNGLCQTLVRLIWWRGAPREPLWSKKSIVKKSTVLQLGI